MCEWKELLRPSTAHLLDRLGPAMSVARVPMAGIELPVAESAALALVAPVGVDGARDAARPGMVLAHGRVRRLVELTVASTLLLLLAPLLLVVSLAVLGTSRGPLLYRQERVGAGGQPFLIIKFRTMHRDAERHAEMLFAHRNDGSGPLSKLHDDPRVTKVGRVLRRFSVDELPQLWNVLNGSMALVGPRPATQVEVRRFAPGEHRRHLVRPGITGLAQVSGRSDLDWDRAVALDLHYIARRSVRRDLVILLRTVPAVLRGRGAY